MVGGTGQVPTAGLLEEKGLPYFAVNICQPNSAPAECFGFQGLDFFRSYESSVSLPNDPLRCKRISFDKMEIANHAASKIELQCPFLFGPSLQTKFQYVIFDKDKAGISFLYSTIFPSSNYEKYLPIFEKVLNSVSFVEGPNTSFNNSGSGLLNSTINSGNVSEIQSGLSSNPSLPPTNISEPAAASDEGVNTPSAESSNMSGGNTSSVQLSSNNFTTQDEIAKASNQSSISASMDNRRPPLDIQLSVSPDPAFVGQDLVVYVNVVDFSSKVPLNQAKIEGAIVGGSAAEDLIKNPDTNQLQDIAAIEGQKFSGLTDTNGQFTDTTRLSGDFPADKFAIVVTATAEGYDPVSKIGVFTIG